MERKMLALKLQEKTPCSESRKRTKITDITEYTLKQKRRRAAHIARMKDNRWTKRCTEWQPMRGKRSRGQPTRKERTTWIRKATDRGQWKALMEGYILQWINKAQAKGETGKQRTEDNGRHWWRATSCSGWTKPWRKAKQLLSEGCTATFSQPANFLCWTPTQTDIYFLEVSLCFATFTYPVVWVGLESNQIKSTCSRHRL